jgi:phosphoserine phosphatase
MTKLLLTRHGHVEGIDPERFRGRIDLPLTPLGREQARTVARYIAAQWQPTAIFSSQMSRCVTTANEIGYACGLEPQVLDGLNDVDYGEWQWKTYEDVQLSWPMQYDTWRRAPHLVRFPGGDSLQDLVARTAEALRVTLTSYLSRDDIVVLVGHDSVNRALLLQLLDQPLSAYWRLAQSPCSISEIDIVDSEIKIKSVNETQHLRGVTV